MPGVIQTDLCRAVPGAAVDHLVDSGYRRIAYVGGEPSLMNTVRAESVARALRDRGIRTAPITYLSEGEVWRAPDELAATIAADLPEALVCYDDKLASALMDALRSLGIHVPRDVGIVGFDGIPFAGISNPRLTTVAVPSAEMGSAAASSLIDASARPARRRGDHAARPRRPREHADHRPHRPEAKARA